MAVPPDPNELALSAAGPLRMTGRRLAGGGYAEPRYFRRRKPILSDILILYF
jgi:hypothetical protein